MFEQPESEFGLHPWPIVQGALFELNADRVIEIIDATGLNIDWSLTRDDNHSHATRKRAFRPRIGRAVSALSEIDRLSVASRVATEVLRYASKEVIDAMDHRLRQIGWRLEDDGLVSVDPQLRERFFPGGSQHDAYVEIRRILGYAKKRITIIDNYVGGDLLELIASSGVRPLSIRLLSRRLPQDFATERRRFSEQYTGIDLKVRLGAQFHDRFVVIDGSRCYHIGASIKDAGKRGFMISEIEDHPNRESLIAAQDQAWAEAVPSIDSVQQRAASADATQVGIRVHSQQPQ